MSCARLMQSEPLSLDGREVAEAEEPPGRVDRRQLSAHLREGQNARLAAKLTGATIDIMSDDMGEDE